MVNCNLEGLSSYIHGLLSGSTWTGVEGGAENSCEESQHVGMQCADLAFSFSFYPYLQ